MSGRLSLWLRFRFLTVALALACQISAGAAVPMREASEAPARLAASVAIFCQSGVHTDKHGGAPLHRQVPDHALARILSDHGHAAAVLTGGPCVDLPVICRMATAAPLGARAPPARPAASFFPRGPPHTV